ncbi:MAG: glucose 1-dehydrogenase [Halioglobus sp.]|nr:glucose 1-dehydrogenase [Halioglobus sp.]
MTKDLFSVSGETVMVTGGGTGLGRQYATVLARAGATIVLCARRTDKLEETAASIRQAGGQAHCIAMDVSDSGSVAQGFERCREIAPVSVLVNNAGITCEPMLLDLSEPEWDRVLDTNLKGAWLVARAAAQQMIEHGRGGSIINIASVLGTCVQKGTGPYSVAKSALLHLTRSLALEWARYEIRVNAIAPGYYRTEMAQDYLDSASGQRLIKRIPQRRLGDPSDMDGALLLLASPASTYMTGSVVSVDGGLSLSIV